MKEDDTVHMSTSNLVGREAQLRQLQDLAVYAMNHQGSTLFIEATAGMGTTTLLRKFEELIYNDPELNETVLINVPLDKWASQNPYYPFVEILDRFGKFKLKHKDRFQKLREIIIETAPDWIDLIPVCIYYRSAIVALSLLGKLALMELDIESAIKHSTRAVQYLEKMGTMPLVRMEEIFFNHYVIMKSAQYHDAKNYLYRAYGILQRKANSLKSQEHKDKFLHRVSLSYNILSEFSTLNDNNALK